MRPVDRLVVSAMVMSTAGGASEASGQASGQCHANVQAWRSEGPAIPGLSGPLRQAT